jgi:hypothetical protein
MSRLFKFEKENLGVSDEQLLQNPGMNKLDIFMSGLDTNGDSIQLIGNKILPYSIEQGTIIYCSTNGMITYRFEAIDGNGPKKINGEKILDVRNIDKLPTPVRISNVPGISKGHAWPFLNIEQISYIEEQQQHNINIDEIGDDALSDDDILANLTITYMAERISFQLGIEQCSCIELISRAKLLLGIEHAPIFTNAQSNIRTKITYIYNQIV